MNPESCFPLKPQIREHVHPIHESAWLRIRTKMERPRARRSVNPWICVLKSSAVLMACMGYLGSASATADGLYLVTRTATQAAELPSVQRVTDRLRAELLRDKREKVGAAFEQTIRSAIPVELFPERLAKVPWQAAAPSMEDTPPENP